MEDCLFCKIVAGTLPCQKIAESKHFLAFLDIAPVQEGHTLIIPKQHSTNFLDLPEHLGTEFLTFAQSIGQAVIAGTDAEGFNVGLNNGPAAGQVVFHTHFHVIPRKKGDGLTSWPQLQASADDLTLTREKVVDALNSMKR